ncbi:MAG: hypothetical protein ACI8RZ_005465 [Myxococcota bacterium]|jgi:hypothetical protein
MCADMLVKVESARSACYQAGWAVDHAPDEVPLAAATAASYCGEAFFSCAGENIQIHGGIGFTWEHDAHLFFKRARAAATSSARRQRPASASRRRAWGSRSVRRKHQVHRAGEVPTGVVGVGADEDVGEAVGVHVSCVAQGLSRRVDVGLASG